jgi:hypothetical protein
MTRHHSANQPTFGGFQISCSLRDTERLTSFLSKLMLLHREAPATKRSLPPLTTQVRFGPFEDIMSRSFFAFDTKADQIPTPQNNV